jgi:hypothetical protein
MANCERTDGVERMRSSQEVEGWPVQRDKMSCVVSDKTGISGTAKRGSHAARQAGNRVSGGDYRRMMMIEITAETRSKQALAAVQFFAETASFLSHFTL